MNCRKISREEFIGEAPKPKVDPDAKAELAFNVFDKNHDGYVTKSEMLKASKNLTKEQVRFFMPPSILAFANHCYFFAGGCSFSTK